jgi:hypothetical protein
VDLGHGSALVGSGASATSTFTTTAALSVGSHTFQAVYTPSGSFVGSSGTTPQTVAAVTTTGVTSSLSPSALGQSVTFTALVTNVSGDGSTPTGGVEFFDDSTATGLGAGKFQSAGGGSATFVLGTAGLSVGGHTIRAEYTPAGAFLVSRGFTSQTVNAPGPTHEPVVLLADGSLVQQDPTGAWRLISAGPIEAISTVTDAAGRDVVFAITRSDGHHLWRYDGAGWGPLSPVLAFQQLSAATNRPGNAVAFGVATDGTLWEYSSLFAATGNWREVSAGIFLSISVVTDASGNETVFGITALDGGQLHEYSPAGPASTGGWSLVSPGQFRSISAGLNSAGQAVVFGVLSDNNVWENDPALGNADPRGNWRNLSGSALPTPRWRSAPAGPTRCSRSWGT